MYKKHDGFTLIELMITVAVLGVLAAIASSSYKDYVARAQVSEAVGLGGEARLRLSEWAADHNSWPTIVAPGVTPGEGQINLAMVGKYSALSSAVLGIYPSGILSIEVTKGVSEGGFLTFTTNNGGTTWACGNTMVDGIVGSGTTLEDKYLPQACKK